jgi:hypothetical protein
MEFNRHQEGIGIELVGTRDPRTTDHCGDRMLNLFTIAFGITHGTLPDFRLSRRMRAKASLP